MSGYAHVAPMFYDIVVSHFELKPIRVMENEWMINGYTSTIKVFSRHQFEKDGVRGCDIEPTFDFNREYHLDKMEDERRYFEAQRRRDNPESIRPDKIYFHFK